MILIIIEDVPSFTVIEWDMYDDFCYVFANGILGSRQSQQTRVQNLCEG